MNTEISSNSNKSQNRTIRLPLMQEHAREGVRWAAVFIVAMFLILSLSACDGLLGSAATDTPEPTITPTATLAPTQTPTPVAITADQDLAVVIDAADDGDTLYLAAGTFTLAQGIEITKSLTIIGAGSDQTTIISTLPGEDFMAMIKYSGTGSLSIQGVKLLYDGKDPSTVMLIYSGSVMLSECYLGGATLTDSGSGLCDLYIEGDVVVNIVDCQIAGGMADNAMDSSKGAPGGIYVGGTASLTVEGGEISDANLGIYAFGDAETTIKNTTFYNTYIGVSLTENSTAILEDNMFTEIPGGHFVLTGESTGTATGNTFVGTWESIGVQVGENANVYLEENSIQNVADGIVFMGNATGEVVANEILFTSNAGNTVTGISVQGDASPLLDSNILAGAYSTGIGILYSGNATGEATGNELSSFESCISLDEQANPSITANTITDSTVGISAQDESSGTMTMNTIEGCNIGIAIYSPAQPTITNNTIKDCISAMLSDPEEWLEELPISDNTIEGDMSDYDVIVTTKEP